MRYTRITGSRAEKLSRLDAIRRFADLDWQDCYSGWDEPMLPKGEGDYYSWPLLTDLFPWQYSGVQMKRTWVIGETRDVLKRRWSYLTSLEADSRRTAFRETGSRNISQQYESITDPSVALTPIAELAVDEPPIEPIRYGYRSFDRQWILPDGRLGDRLRPPLWQSRSDRQVFMTSLLTGILGLGPAVTISAHITDLHHFCNRGGKDIIPLYRDAVCESANITGGLLDVLKQSFGFGVAPEDLFAYAYALLASPAYVDRFSEELTVPGPRLPLTRDSGLFRKAAALGRTLVWLHTFGDRLVPGGKSKGTVPRGIARCLRGVPDRPESYPEKFSYEPATKTLRVGEGEFGPVPEAVWEFSVSGLQVVKSWLSYRIKPGAGRRRRSSPLDDIRPERWTSAMTEELLQLFWVLEATVALFPAMEKLLDEIAASELFNTGDLPQPSPEERKAPPVSRGAQMTLEAGT